MLSKIRSYFEANIQLPSGKQHTVDSDHALQLATAALLIEMTHADYHVDADETRAVYDALGRVFKLSATETEELIGLAEQEVKEAASLYQFTRLVDKEFTPDQKTRVVEMLWRVAFSDGHKDKYEEHLVRKVADLLHVSHKDFIWTRHKVEEELAGSSS